jgi:hypothetical protein
MNDTSSTIVKLNVGGKRFETLRSTLLSVEGTFFSGLLSDCSPENGEYFIDRNGDKFTPILEYLRNKGNSNEYIDPMEASFYALPLPLMPFHEIVQKDVAIAREFFIKYQNEILEDLALYYQEKRRSNFTNQVIPKRGINSISWTLFNNHPWNLITRELPPIQAQPWHSAHAMSNEERSRRDQQHQNQLEYQKQNREKQISSVVGYQSELMHVFPPQKQSLHFALLAEAESFWLPQGVKCSFMKHGDNLCDIYFTWKPLPNVDDSVHAIEKILQDCVKGEKRFRTFC